ncbi:hypothetical protein [Rubrolithibacter danxiaensis]|uniref:hypothetical protein n=1 Tax=Rubrolithibacter danxiaensis TaxID=3390805 RepID=UPI003BF91897
MEARELRVGNLIKVYPKPGEEVVLAVRELHRESIVGEFLRSPGFYMRASYKDLNPIPFDKSWLEKFNFYSEGKYWIINKGTSRFGIETEEEESAIRSILLSNNTHISGLELNAVHQLQNIFYITTGQDLE